MTAPATTIPGKIPWAQRGETGRGYHATESPYPNDVINRALKWAILASGGDPDADPFPGFAIGPSMGIANVMDVRYAGGAKGDGSNDDRAAIVSALSSGLPVYFPPNKTYRCLSVFDIPARTVMFGLNSYNTVIRLDAATSGQSFLTSLDASSGPDGYIRIHGLMFQNLAASVANVSCMNFTSSVPFTKITDCRFSRWTKYGINLDLSYVTKIEDCYFDGIFGISGSGDIGTPIIADNQTHLLTLRRNSFLRCDRPVQVTGPVVNLLLDNNHYEQIGYKYDANGNVIDNTEHANYSANVLNSIRGLRAINQYFEAIRVGDCYDLNGIRGAIIESNYMTGSEPSSLGGSVVGRRFATITDHVGLTIKGNYISEYTDANWISVTTPNGNSIDGLESNFVEDAATGVDPVTNASGVAYKRRDSIGADVGDANVTLTVGVSAPIQRYATTLTGNRTVTLSTTNAKNGDQFRIVRTGLGAFTLDVGGLKTIASATAAFVDVGYDGSAWRLIGYGAL